MARQILKAVDRDIAMLAALVIVSLSGLSREGGMLYIVTVSDHKC